MSVPAMTTRDELIAWATRNGWKLDRWGHLKKEFDIIMAGHLADAAYTPNFGSRNVKLKLAAIIIKYVGLPIAACAFIYSASLKWYPPAAGAMLVLTGRGARCGLVQTIQACSRLYNTYPVSVKNVQASSRILRRDSVDGLQLVETEKGEFWEPVCEGSAVMAQLAELDSKYYGLAQARPRAGDIVFDCGANVGVFSREALSLGAKLVVAIEPAPINLECLRRNLASEIASGRVLVCAQGLWNKEATLHLYENNLTAAMDGFVKRENTREGPVIPLTTIDRLVDELKLKRVDFIKMDIEGAERHALAGGLKTFRRFRPRLEISTDHLPDDCEVIPKIVRQAWPGYHEECLLCNLEPLKWRVKAEILYFHP